MPRTYYKANKSNTGGLLSVSFDSKNQSNKGNAEPKFWFNVVKQNGWDAQNDHGIFSGGQKAAVSFDLHEIAGIINTITEYRDMKKGNFTFFHESSKGSTSGSLHYYFIAPKTDKEKPKEGFGFRLKQGDNEFKVGLSNNEAIELKYWLEYGLEHCYGAIYSQDKKEREERFAEKNKAQDNAPAKKAVPANYKATPKQSIKAAPSPEPETTSDDNSNGEQSGVDEENSDGVDF